MSATLLRDGSRTVIYLGKGRKWHRVIAMRSRHLLVEKLTDGQFASRQYQPHTGDLLHALQTFQVHRAGLSDEAATLIDREIQRIRMETAIPQIHQLSAWGTRTSPRLFA